MAHEIGHAWWADASADCQSEAKAYMCEQNANYQAGHVLIVGYGYNDAAAVQMMWDQLVFMAQNGAKPSHGHPDACAELHAFERRVGRSPLYACEEKGR
jgi:N-formylglutamate amidohydrolase